MDKENIEMEELNKRTKEEKNKLLSPKVDVVFQALFGEVGKKEKSIEIAKKMKEKGFDINSIEELTGLEKRK